MQALYVAATIALLGLAFDIYDSLSYYLAERITACLM